MAIQGKPLIYVVKFAWGEIYANDILQTNLYSLFKNLLTSLGVNYAQYKYGIRFETSNANILKFIAN